MANFLDTSLLKQKLMMKNAGHTKGETEGESERGSGERGEGTPWPACGWRFTTRRALSVSLPLPVPLRAWVPPPPLSTSSSLCDKQRQVALVTVIVLPVHVSLRVCVCVWRNWYKQLPRATIRGFVMQEHVFGRCNCAIKQINYTYKSQTHTQAHTFPSLPHFLWALSRPLSLSLSTCPTK